MAEYWKSTVSHSQAPRSPPADNDQPKYYCKQCNVYIRDTAFEKTQHEATAKHQGNLKRFIRDIHRENERQQRESHKAKSEVERLRQTVSGPSAARDTGVPPWKRASPPPKPAQRPVSLEDRKKQIAQLADMGIAIPQEFRGDMAMAGDWQTVSQKVIRPEDSKTSDTSGLSVGVRKRKHEKDEDDEDQETKMFVSKGWGARIREYPGAQNDGDLDALLESTKDIKKSRPTASDTVVQEGSGDSETPIKREEEAPTEHERPSQPKGEEQSPTDKTSIPPVKSEEEEPAPEVVFKKRKPKAMRK